MVNWKYCIYLAHIFTSTEASGRLDGAINIDASSQEYSANSDVALRELSEAYAKYRVQEQIAFYQ